MAKTSGDDVSALQAENARLLEATQAQAAQGEQMLDYLAEMKAEIDALKAGQTFTPSAPVVKTIEAQLDAEYAALREEFKDVPNIEILDRRIEHGTEASPSLRLKTGVAGIPEPSVEDDPNGDRCYWKLRWFNFEIPGRADRFVREGYLKVEREELRTPESIPDMVLTDTYVKKGVRGMEVLGKIQRKYFEHKKKRDAWRSGRLMQSESGLRSHLAAHVSSLAGSVGENADQAGTTANKFSLTIKPQPTERVTI